MATKTIECPFHGSSPIFLPVGIMSYTVNNGSYAVDAPANKVYKLRCYNSSNADGNEIDVNMACGSGTYSLTYIGTKSSAYGVVDIDIDGTEVASFDTYDGSGTEIGDLHQDSIDIASGQHVVTLRVDGKNASSSGYYMSVGALIFTKTAFKVSGSGLCLPCQTSPITIAPSYTPATSVGQGTFVPYGVTSSYFNAIYYNSTGANGDNATWNLWLQPGGYTLKVVYVKSDNAPIVDFSVDGSNVITGVDFYNGSTTYNNSTSATAFSITNEGLHTLTATANSKNGSSSNYYFQITAFIIEAT